MAIFDTQVDIVYLWVDSSDKNWQKKDAGLLMPF
jgi:hypothetical protein